MALHKVEWAQGMAQPQDVELTAAAAISVGDVGYIDSSGRFAKALATGTSTIPVMLIAVDRCEANKGGTFRPWGVIVNKDWSWTAGNKLYLSTSTAGAMTATAPTTYILPVGVALSATAVLFNPAPQSDYTPNTMDDSFSITDAKNITLGTGTGTKFGTGTNQKLAFHNATPVAQQANTTDLKDLLVTYGFLATGGASPLNLDGGTLTGVLSVSADSTLSDGVDFALGTSNGTKLGTASTQKLAFLGATPVVRQGNTTDLKDLLVTFGLLVNGGATPLNLDSGALSCGAATIGADSTLNDGVDLVLATTTGTKIGTVSTQKLAFLGATPVARTAFATAAIATTVAKSTTTSTQVFGFATSTQANAIVALANEFRAAMVTLGFKA